MSCRLCGEDHEEPYGRGPGLVLLKEREPMPSDYELTERLYTDAEKTRIVPENHPDAAYLLGVPGDRIPHDQAERLGLRKSGDAGPESAESLDAGAGAEAFGEAATDAATVTDKAVRGSKER